MLRRVKIDPSSISQMDQSDPEFLLDAIEKNYRVIWYIKEPKPIMVEMAVKQNILALRGLPKQCDAINLLAIGIDPRALKYIPEPDERTQMAAISRNGLLVGLIENPSVEIQMAAVDNIPDAITRIKKPAVDAQLLAVGKNYTIITKIPDPSVDAIKMALGFQKQQKPNPFRSLIDLTNLKLTTDDWWKIVQAFPEYHAQMNLNDEQISYAILCS